MINFWKVHKKLFFCWIHQLFFFFKKRFLSVGYLNKNHKSAKEFHTQTKNCQSKKMYGESWVFRDIQESLLFLSLLYLFHYFWRFMKIWKMLFKQVFFFKFYFLLFMGISILLYVLFGKKDGNVRMKVETRVYRNFYTKDSHFFAWKFAMETFIFYYFSLSIN